jgi:uncharacterized membrane protein (DUF4010 family)
MDLGSIVWTAQLRFIVALILGFLVGLERESTKVDQKLVFGGVRTHPIISLFGFGCAWLYKLGTAGVLPIGLLCISVLTGIAYVAKIRSDRFGTTSEVSALLTFVTGALALLADIWIAMALGIVNTILLSEKAALESYVERLSKVEFLAAVKFLLVTVIIYPVLPNQDFTQFNINPIKIWQIVIIVSTLGFVGYLLEKRFGEKIGLWLSGILGGIVSSTAITISMGRMAKANADRAEGALQATLLASSVSYLRMLVLVWFISPLMFHALAVKFFIITLGGILLSLKMFHSEQVVKEAEITELQNPFEIKPAVVFGILFVAISVATGFVKTTIGNSGILGLSVLVGLTDVTPFIMTLSNNAGEINTVFTAAIILTMMSNTIAKAFYFGALSATNRKETTIKYGILALLHIPMLLF